MAAAVGSAGGRSARPASYPSLPVRLPDIVLVALGGAAGAVARYAVAGRGAARGRAGPARRDVGRQRARVRRHRARRGAGAVRARAPDRRRRRARRVHDVLGVLAPRRSRCGARGGPGGPSPTRSGASPWAWAASRSGSHSGARSESAAVRAEVGSARPDAGAAQAARAVCGQAGRSLPPVRPEPRQTLPRGTTREAAHPAGAGRGSGAAHYLRPKR